MNQRYAFSIISFATIILFSSCEKDAVETPIYQYYTPEEYAILTANLDLPATPFSYSNELFHSTNDNDAVSTLGRVLFYDKQLSLDQTVSCGSCHQQQFAFSDDVAFSTGIMNRSTARNSLALGAFSNFQQYSGNPETTLFWDGRVNSLHDQMIQTIGNPNEMGMELDAIAQRINQFDYFHVLSRKAFGNDQLNEDLILLALERFMNSMQSSSSKFDKVVLHIGIISPNLIPEFSKIEKEGQDLFFNNCFQCHSHGIGQFSANQDEVRDANNGLDLVYNDKGKGELDPHPDALAIFKVPGLKNIALTAPYMHDGRFSKLEDVIHFYSNGIQDHPNLHPLLKENGQPKKFNFTESQVDALVAFLKTLTDSQLNRDPKWSDPFL